MQELLAQADVLIDGPYVASKDDGLGLRGSSNQKVHYLTERLRGVDFEGGPRSVEMHMDGEFAMMVGVPTREILETLETSMKQKGTSRTP